MDIFVHWLNLTYLFVFLFLYVQGFDFNPENIKPTRTVSSRLAYSVCDQRRQYSNTRIIQKPVKIRPMTFMPVPCGWFKLDNYQTISFRKCVQNPYPGKSNRKSLLLNDQLAHASQRTTKLPSQLAVAPSSHEPLATKKSPIRSIIKGYLKSNSFVVARKSNMVTPPVPTTKAHHLLPAVSNGHLHNNRPISQNGATEKYLRMTSENKTVVSSMSTRTLNLETRNNISTKIPVITTNSNTEQTTTTTAPSLQNEIENQTTLFALLQAEKTSTMSNEIDVTSSVHYEDPHYEILSQEKSTAVIKRPHNFIFLCTISILMLLNTL